MFKGLYSKSSELSVKCSVEEDEDDKLIAPSYCGIGDTSKLDLSLRFLVIIFFDVSFSSLN